MRVHHARQQPLTGGGLPRVVREVAFAVSISVGGCGCGDSPSEPDGSTASLAAENSAGDRPIAPAPPWTPAPYVHTAPPAQPANLPGDPERRDVRINAAREQIAAGQWKKAIATLESALAVGPETATLRLLLGIARSNHTQDLQGARREFERALALDPKNADAMVYLAEVETAAAHHDLARSYVEGAVLADPDHKAALVMAVEMRSQSAEYEAAEELVEHLLLAHPDVARGYAERAALRQRSGDTEAAIADLRRAVELDPIDTAARWALATVLRRDRRTEEAEQARVDFELLKSIFSKSMHDLETDPAERAAILEKINERFPALWQGRIEAAKWIAAVRGPAAALEFLLPIAQEFPDVAAVRAHLAAYMDAVGDASGAERQRAELARIERANAEAGS